MSSELKIIVIALHLVSSHFWPSDEVSILTHQLIPVPVLPAAVYSERAEPIGRKCGGTWDDILCLPGAMGVLRHSEGECSLWTALPWSLVQHCHKGLCSGQG